MHLFRENIARTDPAESTPEGGPLGSGEVHSLSLN